MTEGDTIRQDKAVKRAMAHNYNMNRLLGTPKGQRKYEKLQMRLVRRERRLDKINHAINTFGESSARVIVVWFLLILTGSFTPWFIMTTVFPGIGRVVDWILGLIA